MKAIFKLMGILLVFVNTNYAVDAIVLMASRGSVSYSFREVNVSHRQDRSSRFLSIPMLWCLSDVNLDTVDPQSTVTTDAFEDDSSETVCREEEAVLASKPIPIRLTPQFNDSDDDEGGVVPHSLPKSRRSFRKLGVRRASVLVGSSTEAFMLTVPDSDVSDDDSLSTQEHPAHETEGDDDLKKGSFSSLAFLNSARQGEDGMFDSEYDEIFSSGEFHRVSVLGLTVASESPLWIPGEEITVTFTHNNTREIVMWGGRVEKNKIVNSVPQQHPAKYQPPLTPVNKVARRSVIRPDGRTLDSRLREAAIGSSFPIQFEVNPLTGEDRIKVMTGSELITQIET